jgi:hypothetical protein
MACLKGSSFRREKGYVRAEDCLDFSLVRHVGLEGNRVAAIALISSTTSCAASSPAT